MKRRRVKQILQLDKWQEEVLNTTGNICLRSGRQVGKSTVISIKAAEFAVKNRNKIIMVIAAVERQAYLLFEKILSYLQDNYKSLIKKGKDKPTKHKISLTNGSEIYSLPTGLTGYGIRGYTINLLIADEAAFIPEEVWTAVTPMLAVTKGDIWLLSTPHGKGGYYYNSFSNPNFKSFHISAEDCPRRDEEFLKQERKRMTQMQYAQEYLGEFVDKLMQVFPDDLIKKCMILKRRGGVLDGRKYYIGVDIARMGADESTFEILDRTNREELQHVENITTIKTLTTETTEKIKQLDRIYHFAQIFVDDGGLGVGVFDQLLTDEQTKRKVVAINNSDRPLDREELKKKKVLKEDIYNNLLMLMERGKIQLLDDPEIYMSLKSVQFEIDDNQRIKYFGNYTHIAEGLIRAAWCVKDKTLNIYRY